MLLEVARYLGAPAADTASDPAFSAYHALLQFDGASEQLQELGALTASGYAVPVGAMAWAVQQGKIAAAVLPGPATPTRYAPADHHDFQFLQLLVPCNRCLLAKHMMW